MNRPLCPWPVIESTGRRFGYARVSTKDQKLRMQKDALNAVQCDRIFTDHGVSGSRANRPGLNKMLRALRPGDAVVILKLDRLGRSVLHLADLAVYFRKNDIELVSLSEGINTTTPGGKLIYHVFSAVAEFQRDMLIENTLDGLAAASARGRYPGRPRLLDPQTVLEAQRHIAQYGTPRVAMAQRLGVSRMTLDRAIRRINLDDAA